MRTIAARSMDFRLYTGRWSGDKIVVVTWRTVLRLVIGIGLVGLGLLWLLQGADAVHVRPVLCATHCKPVTGGSSGWLAAGVVTLVIGTGILIIGGKDGHRLVK